MDIDHELDRVANLYRAQGYEITVLPGPDQLPSFARDFSVEIVGHENNEGVLVAVRKNRDALASDENMQRYAEVIGNQPGWRFDFAILEAENPNAREVRGAQEFTESEIEVSLQQADELIDKGYDRYAVIAAWAGLEAAMRIRLRAWGQEIDWSSNPRQMLKELYSTGAISPDEFHQVSEASQIRNRIVHGFKTDLIQADQSDSELVQVMSTVARRLINQSPPTRQTA